MWTLCANYLFFKSLLIVLSMYKLVYQKSTCYPYCSAYWPQFLKNLNKECIQYLEIGSLHGGSLLMFHNMFGPNVQSTSIDPFMQCDHYTEYMNAHEENFEIYKFTRNS